MGLVDSLSAYSPRWSPSRCGGSAGYASSRFLPPMAAVFRPRMSEIEFALQFVLALLNDDEVVERPADFSHQWCEFLVAGAVVVEVPHAAEILRYR